MKTNLFALVRDQYSPAATGFLGDLLGQHPDQLKGSVDSAIDTVIDGFTSVARHQGGREQLYEEIRYSDELVVADPASGFQHRDSREVFAESTNRLAGIVGIASKEKMIASLCERTGLSDADAENMLGYVTPGVLGALKQQISTGKVLDNPDGVGQMFLGEGDIGNVDTSKRPVSGGIARATAATAHAESEPDRSWLVRYAMPAALMGGLVIGGANDWGNHAENRIVEDQRAKLQSELDEVRAKNVEAQGKIFSLQSDFDSARTQTTELTSQTASLTAELDNANGRVIELEAELGTAVARGNAARAEVESLSGRATTLTAELDEAKVRIHDLQSELDSALTVGNAAQAEVDKTKAEIEAAKANIEIAETELSELNTQAADLANNLAVARSRVSDLESELNTSRLDVSSLRSQVTSVTSELNRVKDVPADVGALQELLAGVAAERDSFFDSNRVNKSKLQTAISERDFARGKVNQLASELRIAAEDSAKKEREVVAGNRQIDDLESRLRTSTERLLSLDTRLFGTNSMLDEEKASSNELRKRLTEMTGLRDKAISTLAIRDDEISSLGDKINTLQINVQTLEDANASAQDKATAFQQQIASLNGELEATQADVAQTSATLSEREQSLQSLNANLETANNELAAVTTERNQLLSKRDALAAQIKELMSEKDAVVAETVRLQGTVDSLTTELDAARAAGGEADTKLSLLNDSMRGLEKELRLITGARDQASDQAKLFRTQASDLQIQVEQLESDLVSAQAAHDEATSTAQTAHNDAMASMQAEQKELSGQITTMSDDLTSTRAELTQANDDIAAINSEKEAAIAQIKTLQERGIGLQSSLDAKTDKVGELESAVAVLEADNAALIDARDGANEQAGKLRSEVEMLKEELSDERSTVMQLKETITSLESENSGVTGERDKALGTIESLQSELAMSKDEVSLLDSTRRELQQQIDDAAARVQSVVDDTLAVRDSIAAELSNAGIDAATVSSIDNDTAVAITLGSGDLYGVGSASLSRSGTTLLDGVGQVIAGYPGWRVDVEGHTDAQGIGKVLRQKYPTNWELSTARASSAVRYLASRSGLDAAKISARGYADTRPIASNDSANGREQNRRVEIILRK